MSRVWLWLIETRFDPKLTAAQELWRRYPGEIAADLRRDYGVRVADWHRGTMSSHELLELLEHADSDGAFKTAVRQGEPSQQRKAVLQIANELAILRAVQYPDLDGELWGSQFFFTPKLLRGEAEHREASAGAMQGVFAIGAINTNDD